MTIISQPVVDIAGAADQRAIYFSWRTVRESADGTKLITTKEHQFIPVAGVLTTTSLDPGPCQVKIAGTVYNITIPPSGTVLLTPLIAAGLPPTSDSTLFVHNGGNFAMARTMTAAAYAALIAVTTPDHGSTFFIY